MFRILARLRSFTVILYVVAQLNNFCYAQLYKSQHVNILLRSVSQESTHVGRQGRAGSEPKQGRAGSEPLM